MQDGKQRFNKSKIDRFVDTVIDIRSLFLSPSYSTYFFSSIIISQTKKKKWMHFNELVG